MKRKAAIYHFTNESKQRPKIYRDQLEALREYAESVGLDVADIYCDMSLKRSERTEFDRFLANSNQYDVLVTKDFYHIEKNTGKCLGVMQQLRDNGLQIYSIENGIFTWEDAPFDKPLRVATYTCHFGTSNEMKEVIPVRNDIFTLFTCKKTNWTVLDQYSDESLHQKDCEQIQMKELIWSYVKI
ncbi:recombinase family protein [Candidatus Weimeria sp. HCP3S3_B5]|uniref:recombinase family protein n=1 Tax=Candidatus Weimeria sp. HCP3S3_B5 TaxID=3438871 RepID=UPI003F8C75EA